MVKKFIASMSKPNQDKVRASHYRDLIRAEASIGGKLFGTIPEGHRREFFCLDKHTWIWHEEWLDERNQRHIRTTRYDVRPDGLLKSQDGSTYQAVSVDEARNFIKAAKMYHEKVKTELYSHV